MTASSERWKIYAPFMEKDYGYGTPFSPDEQLMIPEEEERKIKRVFVYDGHGSQYLNMARMFYDSFEEVRLICEMADNVVDYGLTQIMLNGPAEKLKTTRYAQPAIILANIIFFNTLRRTDPGFLIIKPDCNSGQSLGNLLAVLHSGGFSEEKDRSNAWVKILKLTDKRAQIFQPVIDDCPKTYQVMLYKDETMDKEEFQKAHEKLTEEFSVFPTMITKESTILCGTKENVSKAEKYLEELKEKGIKSQIFNKEIPPFHTPYMEPAISLLKKQLPLYTPDGLFPAIYRAKIPLLTDTENPARKIKEPKDIINSLLRLTEPIRMDAIFEYIVNNRIERIYNFGDRNRFVKTLLNIAIDTPRKGKAIRSREEIEKGLYKISLHRYYFIGEKGESFSPVTVVDLPRQRSKAA